jgi:hypothetical protein
MRQIGLWRYDPITGYWRYVRSCASETALDWLAIFQRDEPNAVFKLSTNRPSAAPKH